jgi:molybdopterin molybdotransferase
VAAELLTLDEALSRVLSNARPLPGELVPLLRANGRVLARDAVAATDLPPFPSSAMDGFAVRAADTPGALPIAFHVSAGDPGPGRLPPGTAAGIATGGAVPEGADAVVPIENARTEADLVELGGALSGDHVRPRGGDVRESAAVVPAGTLLGPVQIGALAAAGVGDVVCFGRPTVAIVATGSELRAPGEPLAPGQIYESNRAMLAAVLGSVAEIDLLPVVADDADAHRAAFERGLEADVLVTSGGVSVGPHDLVRGTLRDAGVDELFWGVAVKPGKPLSFGRRDDTLVFGLPGNPVSSLVGAYLFVKPALLACQGAAEPGPRYGLGVLDTALRRNGARDEFVRARRVAREDGVALAPVSGQESHMIVRAAAADALVHVPRGSGEIPAGMPARYLELE